MPNLLSFTKDLPTQKIDANQIIVQEGTSSQSLWILVDGQLQVKKGDVVINTITRPGAIIGEISILLKTNYSATVESLTSCELKYVEDAEAFLASPEICRLVAEGLAERLSFLTVYLADLKNQYADAPGLAMVSDVLNELAQRQAPAAKPGSLRDPNPEY